MKRIVIAYILNYFAKPSFVPRQLTLLNIVTDQIAEDAAKIFMPGVSAIAGRPDHIQQVILTFSYLSIYQRINFGFR